MIADRPERLFVYGSLQPGGPNQHVPGDLDGQWEPATVRGELRVGTTARLDDGRELRVQVCALR